MNKSFLICSGKGGVGKTCTTINLGVALGMFGKDITIVDANLPTPNIALHLKIPVEVKTLNDVIRGEAGIEKATYLLKPRVRVIPAAFGVESLQGFEPKKFKKLIKKIEANNDLTLIDCAPGLGVEVINALKASENAIIVLNPELPSLADASKTIQIAQDLGVEIAGVIINRSGRFKHELTDEEIVLIMGNIKILGKVPEDSLVASSVSFGQPVVTLYPFSPAAYAFKQIAATLIGKKYEEKTSIMDRFNTFLARRR
ncbi:MAG: cell division ATPase MinD [Candidatus Diapherotrites archaeon]